MFGAWLLSAQQRFCASESPQPFSASCHFTSLASLSRYYMSNCCFKGDLCPFSHDWDDKPDTVCRYYLKGACINGKNCRYDHVRPARVTQQQELQTKQSTSSQYAPDAEVFVMINPLPNCYRPSRVSVPKPVNLPSLSSATSEVGGGYRPHHVAPPPRRVRESGLYVMYLLPQTRG